jgi:hypothetical protein
VLCWFDGDYSRSRIPTVIHRNDVVHLWQDFRNNVLNSEGAKPFHFGVQVVRRAGDEPEIWGWSYRRRDFWHNVGGDAFVLAIGNQPQKQCCAP